MAEAGVTAHDDAMAWDLTDAEAFDPEPPRCTCRHDTSNPERGCECGYADWLCDNGATVDVCQNCDNDTASEPCPCGCNLRVCSRCAKHVIRNIRLYPSAP